MAKTDQEIEITEEEQSSFNLGNLLFGLLGAWSACVVCLMVYTSDAPYEKAPDRAPAESAPEVLPPRESFTPEAYLLSFNSIHFEK